MPTITPLTKSTIVVGQPALSVFNFNVYDGVTIFAPPPATEERPARLKRSHDVAQPPVLRLCAYLTPEQQQTLLQRRAGINPPQLRRRLYHDLDHLFAYPNAAPDEIQDVFQTLANPDLFPAARAALDVADSLVPSPPVSPSSLSEKEVAMALVT